MIPTKFKPLVSDSSEESDQSEDGPVVTKEALEQQALSKYQKALALENNGKWSKAEHVLKELLKSDILMQVKGKICGTGSNVSAMLHLRYCVTLNLGSCCARQDKLKKSLQYYVKASKLDSSDLNLWYKMGTTALKLPDLPLAANAFEEGLRCSPNHWPCIDNLVTVYYALGDHLSCLYYAHRGIVMDAGFVKGFAFKEKIFSEYPTFKEDFALYYPNCKFPDIPICVHLESPEVQEMYSEAVTLRRREAEKWKKKKTKNKEPLRSSAPLKLHTWEHLLKGLLLLLELAENESPEKSLVRPVILKGSEDRNCDSPISIIVEDSEEDEEDEPGLGKDDNDDENDSGKVKTNGQLIEKLIGQNQKRRSARVRSTARREEPSLSTALSLVIPSYLMPKDFKKNVEGWSDDSLHTMDLYRLYKEEEDGGESSSEAFTARAKEERLTSEGYFNTQREFDEVEEFITYAESEKEGILAVLRSVVQKLAAKWNLQWPEGLGKLYVRVYKNVLRYYPPTVIDQDKLVTFEEDCGTLLYGELLLNLWLLKGRNLGRPSPLGDTHLGGDFCSLFLGNLAKRAEESIDLDFFLRSFWLEALLLYYCGDSEPAAMALQKILSDERCSDILVRVPNVSKHAVINKRIVTKLLKSFRRSKSLAEVEDLYCSGYYEQVCDIIIDSLKADPKDFDCEDETWPRLTQHYLLLDSLWKLKKFEECIVWNEACLYEVLTEYRRSNDEDRILIAEKLIKVLIGILSCIDQQGHAIIQNLRPERRARLVQTLSGIINYQLEAPEGHLMPIETVSPWIILHYILKHDCEANAVDVKFFNDSAEDLPSWIQILFIGHDYLGRRSWCCFDEGYLLFHTLKVVYPIVRTLPLESKNLAKITQNVEQIFYCLYGQERKCKGRHLVSHNNLGTNLGLALTWNRAQQVFQFMRPRVLPAYDTSGKCIVTPDQEVLFIKLIECVPQEFNPGRLLPELKKYLNGVIDTVPENSNPLPEDIRDIYYLLGHYYFKNKSWTKAIKYFLLDLCANPARVDSWACLALAKGSVSDTLLNSCETIKNQTEFLNKAARVCRSFEKSLQLDPAQSTLWIERGTFSYSIHSFCSNILKKNQDLSMEMYQIIEDKKTAMIEAAYQCFIKANQLWYSTEGAEYVIDERWLHHYMLGKIAKKRDEEATIYITNYMKSLELLHQIGANYPNRINHAAPQLLSVEVFELYYRIHATMLKALEESEDKPLPSATAELFKSTLTKLDQSPFVVQVNVDQAPKVEKKVRPENSLSSFTDDDFIVVQDADASIADVIVRVENVVDVSLKRKHPDTELPDEGPPAKTIAQTSENEATGTEPQPVASRRSTVTSESNEASKPHLETASEKGLSSCTSSATNKGTSSSSSSSSDSSSSSSDSSSSSGSSDSSSSSSSSSSVESDSSPAMKKIKLEPVEENVEDAWIKNQAWMTDKCLEALECCHKRFKEHYKTLYNLAHYYFKSKKRKSLEKVQQLLLGPGGLFGDRKPTNFFNGVWRIPQNEIDRPGSFAAHMNRSVVLLLDVLAELKDYKMLIELAITLRVVPEAEKKYLRDNEREELCKEAAVQGSQVLRKLLQDYKPEEQGKDFLLEMYQIYKKINRNCLKDTMYGSILIEAYNKYTKETSHTLDLAVRFCAGEIAVQKQQIPNIGGQHASISAPTVPTAKLPSLPEGLSILTEAIPPAPIPKRGRPPGPRKTRDPNEPRKPRGRPPNSSTGPRLPNPAQPFGSQTSSNYAQYLQYQSEMLRQYKELKNASQQLTTSSASCIPLNLPSSLSVSKGVSPSIDAAPILKDRPSLSITPVNKPLTLTSSGPKSPSSISLPPSSTVTKVTTKSFPIAKRPQSPLLTTTATNRAPTVVSSVLSSLTKSMSSSLPRTVPPLPTVSPALQIFPAHSNPPPLASSTSILQKTSPLALPSSSAISISPISPVVLPLPPKKMQTTNLPLSITPTSSLPTYSFPDLPKTYPSPSTLMHSLPQTVPLMPSSQAQPQQSLQHKLLAKKSAAKMKSDPTPPKSKPESMPIITGKAPRPAHGSTHNPHPIPKSTDVSHLPSSKNPMLYNPTPPPAHSSSKLAANVIKKLPESLLILPTGTTREPEPSQIQQHLIDSRLNILNTVPNLDQNVAAAIKSFGSSITITAAKSQKTPYSQETPSSSSSKKPSKDDGKPSKTVSDVIVLDD